MNVIVIYPGRFHPFHRGHMASYEYLTNKYGDNSVYIVTSDVQAPVTSPFSYTDKVTMMTRLGVPAGHVVRVKNPYQAREITDSLSAEEKENTALIFAVSEKDMLEGSARFRFGTKKNGEPSYLQPLPAEQKQLKPMSQHAYVTVTPTVNFRVQGVDANSASQIRQAYIKGSDADRDTIIADLYGEIYPDLRDIFDARLGLNERMQDIIYGKEKIFAGDNPVSIMRENKQKLVALLQCVNLMEQRVRKSHEPDQEELVEDYIEERWSQRYKRNINCNNPKGFSQRAHCAGRKKK
jgi:hypothetical protein